MSVVVDDEPVPFTIIESHQKRSVSNWMLDKQQ